MIGSIQAHMSFLKKEGSLTIFIRKPLRIISHLEINIQNYVNLYQKSQTEMKTFSNFNFHTLPYNISGND